MESFLAGFADELVKLGADEETFKVKLDPKKTLREVRKESKKEPAGNIEEALNTIRGKGRRVSRDYLASTAIGAGLYPLVSLLSRRAGRALHNREILRALSKATTDRSRRQLAKKLKAGPLVGSAAKTYRKGKEPLMTTPELGEKALRGGLTGSLLQVLRDRFAGSAGVD